jgi:hypothetical protein
VVYLNERQLDGMDDVVRADSVLGFESRKLLVSGRGVGPLK